MYEVLDKFDDCDHVLDELYTFALEHDIPVVCVDDEIRQAYWQHKRAYDDMGGMEDFQREGKIRHLNMHVLDTHVRSELEKIAEKGRQSTSR